MASSRFIGQSKYHTYKFTYHFTFSGDRNDKYSDGVLQLYDSRSNYWSKVDFNFEPTTFFKITTVSNTTVSNTTVSNTTVSNTTVSNTTVLSKTKIEGKYYGLHQWICVNTILPLLVDLDGSSVRLGPK